MWSTRQVTTGGSQGNQDTAYLMDGLYEVVKTNGALGLLERRCYISTPSGTIAIYTESASRKWI